MESSSKFCSRIEISNGGGKYTKVAHCTASGPQWQQVPKTQNRFSAACGTSLRHMRSLSNGNKLQDLKKLRNKALDGGQACGGEDGEGRTRKAPR